MTLAEAITEVKKKTNADEDEEEEEEDEPLKPITITIIIIIATISRRGGRGGEGAGAMMMLLRLACALLVHLAPASALTHSCDRNCVCDGVDLSRLKGQMYNMPEVVGPEGREGPDDWEYRISVCEPLPHEKIPMNCVTGSGKPWHAPHVVRFKRPHAMNQSEPTGDCQRVGYDVVLAQATEGGVQLVFTGEDGGKTHTVTANLNCDPQAGGQAVRALRRPRCWADARTDLLV